MRELKRILLNRKNLLIFGVLLLLHGVFFLFQCNGAKANTLTGEALEAYVEGYGAYMQSVQENVTAMKENPLFKKTDSFVYRNLVKTGEDYAGLSEVEPVFGENRGIVTVFNFNLTNFVLLLIGIYIVLCFVEERQKGLYLLVRCTKNGREVLALQRIGILALGLFVSAMVLYACSTVISLVMFPRCDLFRPVQSVPELEGVLAHYTILEYLLLFILRKVLGCLFLCLLLYFYMSIFRSSLCIIAFFLLFLAEYGLYLFIIPTSHLGVLRFMNLYTYVFGGLENAHYYNMNIFGYPYNVTRSGDILVLFCTVLLMGLCLVRYAVNYPKGVYRTMQLTERVKAFVSRLKPTLTLFLWEVKKVLFSQKGIIIMLILFYLAYTASTESHYADFREKFVTHWYEDYHGVITEELVEDMHATKDKMEKKILRWEKSLAREKETLARYALQGIKVHEVQATIDKLEKVIKENKKEVAGLSVVIEKAESGLSFYKETNLPVELFDSAAYDLLFYRDKQTILRNYLYSLLTVVLMLSGIMACEKAAHMDRVLPTVYRGRRETFYNKLVIMLLICIIPTLAIHLIQYVQIGKVFAYTNMDVLVQSIPSVRFFTVPISVRQYLVLLYTFRAALSVMVGSVVMALSSRFSRTTTIALGVFLLVLPIGFVMLRF